MKQRKHRRKSYMTYLQCFINLSVIIHMYNVNKLYALHTATLIFPFENKCLDPRLNKKMLQWYLTIGFMGMT